MTLYAGSCFPAVETALKKCNLGDIGGCEVGNKPWLSGKEMRAVVDKDLRNMWEREDGGRVKRVRIMREKAGPHFMLDLTLAYWWLPQFTRSQFHMQWVNRLAYYRTLAV
jgi:hypothetical protein